MLMSCAISFHDIERFFPLYVMEKEEDKMRNAFTIRVTRTIRPVFLICAFLLFPTGPIYAADLGAEVRKEPEYLKVPKKDRDYYEKGDSTWGNQDLTASAEKAARYQGLEGGKPKYAKDYPMEADGSIDHTKVISNVVRWVADTLSPDGDPASTPYYKVKDIVDKFGGVNQFEPGKNIRPEPGETWVCVDHAIILAYTLRALGYPVREKNVTLSKEVSKGKHEYTYQEAAVNIWRNGSWHYEDAYEEITDKRDLVRNSGYSDLRENAATKAIDWTKLGRYSKTTGNMSDGTTWTSIQTYTKPVASVHDKKDETRIGIQDRDVDPYTGYDSVTGGALADMPYSWYEEENTPFFGEKKNSIPLGFLDERIDLGFPGYELGIGDIGTYFFDLFVYNITSETTDFLIDFSVTNSQIRWSDDELYGQLLPGESLKFKIHLDVVPEPPTVALFLSAISSMVLWAGLKRFRKPHSN